MYDPTPQIDAGFYDRQFLPKPDVTVAGYAAQYAEFARKEHRPERPHELVEIGLMLRDSAYLI